MKTINRIFCSLLLAGACGLGVNAQENQSYFLHTIEKYVQHQPGGYSKTESRQR